MEEGEEEAERSRRRASLPVPTLPLVTAYPFPSCLFPSLPLPNPPAVEETLVRADRLEPEVLPGLECGGGKHGQTFSSPCPPSRPRGKRTAALARPARSREKRQRPVLLKGAGGGELLFAKG